MFPFLYRLTAPLPSLYTAANHVAPSLLHLSCLKGHSLFLQWLLHKLWSAMPQSPFSLSLSFAFSLPFSFILSLIHVFPSPYRLAASALNLSRFYLTLFMSLFGLCCHVVFKFPAIFQRPRPHKRSKREWLIKRERLREWIGEDSIISLSHVSLHVVVIATCLLVCH